MAEQALIPTDAFSRRRRELGDNPGAIGARSAATIIDAYGNIETWHIETFRADGRETAFIQRNAADGGLRLMLPPEVTAALAFQRDRITNTARKLAARKAVATKRSKGIDPAAALRVVRRAKKR